ncbi:ubinuclein-1-like isoform X2 [Malania oleifera]|uniref:ubinuclein-1-like isoform X2 n=1 Tax=Malania oleifera TaxID=397392 RepID=UPI0025AECB80|nr:ubinuclein-1-like isoform X2 [Malania oleifera]
MEEEKSSAGAGDSSRVSSHFVAVGDRQRFTVELRPGETTIVSWKKLVKDANKLSGSSSSAPEPPPSNAHSALESRITPGQPAEAELQDAPAPNRFSAVIEKIERLYMGKQSSDEEDLNDFPDDDQYDTEDSFIDDAELDEYFEVDNSATKHNGFFVNRGKLERINEPTLLPNQQPKKRRRKDLMKAHGEGDDAHIPNKHVKLTKKAAGRSADSAPSAGKHSSTPQNVALVCEKCEDVKPQNQLNASVACVKKKPADTRTSEDPPPSSKAPNGDASTSMADSKDNEKQKTGIFLQPKNLGNKLKDSSGFSEDSHQKYQDRSAHAQAKYQSGRQLSCSNEQELAVRAKEKNGIRELPDLNIPEVKYPVQTVKTPHMHRKEGSSVRPKSTMLEKAIRELEKMVAESRPPSMEVQDADTSSQAVKRRLPREVKQKLAKVARLAASHGKISKELINRLMSILGHLIQLRTLKRNLKIMINTSLSAKQEKDDRFQQIKKEVVEMIKTQFPSLKSKATEQVAGSSEDFQEFGSEEKGVPKRKISLDSAMEDKICDLYDLYIDGLEEDAAPHVRKLYAELAEMWPKGFMDNHSIKRAICRAKDRKKALYGRQPDVEKIKRKKLMPRIEESVRAEACPIAQPQFVRERLSTDSGSHGIASPNRPISTAAVRVPSPLMNGLSLERPKPEKMKGSLSVSGDNVRVSDGALVKKKVKRKPELESGEGHSRLEKLIPQHGEDRHKPHKPVAAPSHKTNLQPVAPASSEQLS